MAFLIAALSHVDHHVVAFDPDRINSDLRAGVMRGLARLGVPLPAMPWTNHFVTFDDTLSQRPTRVQADVIHSRDRPVHIGNADDFIATRKFPSFAFRRKFRLDSKFSEHSALSIQSGEFTEC